MRRKCDKCGHSFPEDDLKFRKEYDEYWCDSCLDNEAEAAYERSLSDPPETLQEQYERAWNEKQKLR